VPTRGEVAAAFDAIADEFDASRTRPWRETLQFETALPRTARVLDLGCGNGRNLAVFAERGHAVVGLDASAGLLARAASRGRRGLVRGDAIALPFSDGSFDAVHTVAALHHLPTEGERRQSATEVARVLRSGGLALFSVWAHEQDRFASGPADVDVPWRRSDGRVVPRFYHLFRGGELEGLVRDARLVVEAAWPERDNHVVLAAKR
jgi:SAM-dependent methyltransferase